MADICPRCGLAVEICACEALVKEEAQRIKVYTAKMRFGKLVTIVEGLAHEEIERTAKELKKKLACGGTAKGDRIVLQGNHKEKVKPLLMGMGYGENTIDVR